MLRVPEPDPAATILALRPAVGGFEVLMVHRNSRGFFGGIAVFPGGKVDAIDVPPGLTYDDDQSCRNAAVREFAEETGILVTSRGTAPAPVVKGPSFYEWLDTQPIAPGVDRLVLVSRWITPETAPRRFDTRFYVVECADPPEVAIDEDELIGYEWVAPTVALERHENGEWSLIRPTISHLRWLQRRTSIDDVISSARGADGRTLIIPRMVADGSLLPIHIPAELS